MADSKKNLMSVRQFVEAHPAFINGGIRNILWYADANGLEKCGGVKHLGKRILIDCDAFFAWLDTNPSITG